MPIQERRCTTCILPSCYPRISFDALGECNYCGQWKRKWQHRDLKKREIVLDDILRRFRKNSSAYDCIVGMSGGKDSCYVAYVLKQKGMNPLAVTFDNGFLTETAVHNIRAAIDALSIAHIVVKPSWSHIQDLYRQFLLTAGEFCTVCNVGIRAALYRTAKNYGINLIVSGHSGRTEAPALQEFYTCSPGYFRSVCGTFAKRQEISSYMYFGQMQRVIWHLAGSPSFMDLPDYVPWKEQEFLEDMKKHLNWKGPLYEQHTDCSMNDAKEYLKLKKFGVTEMTAKLSTLILDGQLGRDEALAKAEHHIVQLRANEEAIREHMRKTLDMNDGQLDHAIGRSHLPYLSKADTLLLKLKDFLRQ